MAKYSNGKDYKVIALCTAKFYGSEETELIETLYKYCAERNYRIVVFSTFSDFYNQQIGDESEKKIFSLLDPRRFDAVVISTETFKREGIAEDIARRCIEANVPVISLIKPLEGCINISFGYEKIFGQIVRHLVEEHKFTKFVFIAGMKNNSFSDARIECFKSVLNEHNIPFSDEDLYYGDFWEGPTANIMDEYLNTGKPLPEAFVCANDFMAMEVCRKLQTRGYEVPRDVVVTGFDGVYLERFNYPRLTTAEQDLETLAEILFDSVDAVSEGKIVKTSHIVDFKFRKSVSCGCVGTDISPEEYKKLGITYSQSNKELRGFVSVFESYFELTARYAHFDSLESIFPRLSWHLKAANVKDFFLMLNTDFNYRSNEIGDNSVVYSKDTSKQYFTDNMVAAMNYRDEEFKDVVMTKPGELTPDFETLLDNNVCILFTSQHMMGKTYGYVANSLDAERMRFATYYGFLMCLRQIIETHKVKQDLDNLYSLDLLTKLYNRRGFYNRITQIFEKAKEEEKQFAVISFDMNWLKQINDTFGHNEGDNALSAVAESMRHHCVEGEICSRFGGDEFAIAFMAENAEERAKNLISLIRKDLAASTEANNKKYNQSISVGFWAAVPGSGQEIGEFIRLADERMYVDKKRIKGTETWLRM